MISYSMKVLISLLVGLLLPFGSFSQKLKISEDGKYLSTEKGKPFFWMGDKFNLKWGEGPFVFNPENATIFGQLLVERYVIHSNVI